MPGKTIGVAKINLTAGTAEFFALMDKSNAKLREFGATADATGGRFRNLGRSVSELQATSGVLRVLEGSLTNNLRASERFVSSVLGLGPVLQKIFPVIGAIAFIGLMSKLGEEVYSFYKTIRDAPERLAGSFRELEAPLRRTNDELRVTGDRLQNDINKLEGKRENTLKLALDEARLAADQLADSIDSTFGKINDFLEKNKVNLWRQLFGAISDKGLVEEFGGKTGLGGYRAEVDKISAEGMTKLAAAAEAGDKKGVDEARAEMNKALQKYMKDIIKELDTQLATARKQAVGVPPKIEQRPGRYGETYPQAVGGEAPKDMKEQIEKLTAARAATQEALAEIALRSTVDRDTAEKARLEAARSNARIDRPFEDRIKQMSAELEGIKAKAMSAGWSESAKAIAEGYANAVKEIEQVNKVLERINPNLKLTQGEMGKIGVLAQEISAAKLEENWQVSLASTTARLKDQTHQQDLLIAAIGKGYAEIKRAEVETRVMAAVGPERFSDDEWMQDAGHVAEVQRIRIAIAKEYDQELVKQAGTAVDTLGTQLEMEKNLAAVQEMGKEAIDRVTLAYKINEIAKKGVRTADGELTEEVRNQIRAEIDLFNAKRVTETAGGVAKINQEITAIRNLRLAQEQGADAARRAQLEAKYAQMVTSGRGAEVPSERIKDELDNEEKVRAAALQTANSYKNQLELLQKHIDVYRQLKAEGHDTVEIEIALRNTLDQQLKLLAEQERSIGTIKAGVRSFFIEMQEDGKKAAEIIHQALTSAVDMVAENLAKAMTLQKTAWGQTFKSIGETMLKDVLKNTIQASLGALGQIFGIKPAQTFDGQSPAKALWVRMAGLPQGGTGPGGAIKAEPQAGEAPAPPSSAPTPEASTPPKSFLRDILAGLGIKLGGTRASGGPVDPSMGYLVGEEGPEILTGTSGKVHSVDSTAGMWPDLFQSAKRVPGAVKTAMAARMSGTIDALGYAAGGPQAQNRFTRTNLRFRNVAEEFPIAGQTSGANSTIYMHPSEGEPFLGSIITHESTHALLRDQDVKKLNSGFDAGVHAKMIETIQTMTPGLYPGDKAEAEIIPRLVSGRFEQLGISREQADAQIKLLVGSMGGNPLAVTLDRMYQHRQATEALIPRATGGPVDVGKQYLVGEKGREIFRPGVPGQIIDHERTKEIERVSREISRSSTSDLRSVTDRSSRERTSHESVSRVFGGPSRPGVSLAGLIPRAGGGDVSSDEAYLVGEQGPEVLTGASGNVIENRRAFGSDPFAGFKLGGSAPDGTLSNPFWVRIVGGTPTALGAPAPGVAAPLPPTQPGSGAAAGRVGSQGLVRALQIMLGIGTKAFSMPGKGGLFGGGSLGGGVFSFAGGAPGAVPLGMPGAAGAGGAPDGTPRNPFHVVMEGGPGVASNIFKDLAPAGGALAGGLAGGVFKKPSQGLAEGGLVSPAESYLVGEEGPEILTGASGRILSNSDMRQMSNGGPVYYVSIDARGTDPRLTEERTHRAILQAHNNAVGQSVLVSHDNIRRNPTKLS